MRITSNGQVTIPEAIRERWGLTPYTDVEFIEEEGHVALKPVANSSSRGQQAVERLRQARLRTQLSTDELLAITRGEEP